MWWGYSTSSVRPGFWWGILQSGRWVRWVCPSGLHTSALHLLSSCKCSQGKRGTSRGQTWARSKRHKTTSQTADTRHQALGGGTDLSGLPWRLRLGHPHKVHVAGQQREVRHVLRVVGTAEVAAGQQNIDDQLQVGFPSNRLPEQNHSCD